MRDRRTRLAIVGFFMVVLAACGGDGEGATETTTSDGIDGAALEATMPGFAAEVESKFGFFTAPTFEESDQILLGYLPTGVQAVDFCNSLSEYVAGEGFEGVDISIRFSGNAPELAAGTSGSDCEAT